MSSTGNFMPSAPPGDPGSSNIFLSALRFILTAGSRLVALFSGGRLPDR